LNTASPNARRCAPERWRASARREPKREYLWILSRTPTVDPAVYQALLGRLAAQGLDMKRLAPTKQ
jgi:apolipoprotein D and lipocalin family protein